MNKLKITEAKKETKKVTEKPETILKHFDKVFDTYNDGEMTKDRMLKNCDTLYKKLSLTFFNR